MTGTKLTAPHAATLFDEVVAWQTPETAVYPWLQVRTEHDPDTHWSWPLLTDEQTELVVPLCSQILSVYARRRFSKSIESRIEEFCKNRSMGHRKGEASRFDRCEENTHQFRLVPAAGLAGVEAVVGITTLLAATQVWPTRLKPDWQENPVAENRAGTVIGWTAGAVTVQRESSPLAQRIASVVASAEIWVERMDVTNIRFAEVNRIVEVLKVMWCYWIMCRKGPVRWGGATELNNRDQGAKSLKEGIKERRESS